MLQEEVFNTSRSYSLTELIVLWPINLQNWFNWIAYANDANIVNKDSPIICIKPVLDDTRHLWLWKIGHLSYSCHGVWFSKIRTYLNILGVVHPSFQSQTLAQLGVFENVRVLNSRHARRLSRPLKPQNNGTMRPPDMNDDGWRCLRHFVAS